MLNLKEDSSTVSDSQRRVFWIRDGDQTIGPELAMQIMKEAPFDGQRRVSQIEVLKHAENIKRSLWLDKSQIHFCRIGSRFYLVNGWHRITAVSLGGRPVEFNVVIYDCDTLEEVKQIYSRFDRVQNSRSDEQAFNALGFSDKLGVTRTVARAVSRAMPFIRNGMKPVRVGDDKTRVEMAIIDIRMDAALAWSKEAKLYEQCVMGAPVAMKTKLFNGGTTAVALQTFKYCEDRAIEFWTGVAEDDGLLKGDPRKTLIQALLGRRITGSNLEPLLIPAAAWNAFFRGQRLTQIKIMNESFLRIAGTPIGRKS